MSKDFEIEVLGNKVKELENCLFDLVQALSSYMPTDAIENVLDQYGYDGNSHKGKPPLTTQERRIEIFEKHLKPLIEDNYEKRRKGELPDNWFWADEIATSWGMFVQEGYGVSNGSA